MKKNKNLFALILGLVLLLGLGQAAQAFLVALGPPNPNTTTGTGTPPGIFGVPTWYGDSNGLALELCLPSTQAELNAGVCLIGAIGPLPIAALGNFPDESFWYAATPDQLVVPAGGALAGPGKAILTLGVELAFVNPVLVDGEQIVFGRLRYRIDVPGPGTYTITTPYGIFTEVVTTAGIKAINVSRDIGVNPGVYTGVLVSDIGPFLRPSATPGGPALPLFNGAAHIPPLPGIYLIDPRIGTTAVTGGPFGNIFRVDGPNIGGPGVNFIQTDQFTLQGRLFSGGTPTPLNGARATYSRPAVGTGFVEVFANSAPTALVTISPAGGILATTMVTGNPLNPSDPSYGKFSARIPITKTTILPASLTITADNSASNPLNTITTTGPNLVDVVTVTSAEYDPVLRTLTIQAASSDEASPPLLTAAGLGVLISGNLTVNNVTSAPGAVTVSSSDGGSGTKAVTVIPPATGTRATYCRPAVGNGMVEVFSKSTPTAVLTVSDPTGQILNTPMVMVTGNPLNPSDPSYGKFFAQIPITKSAILPATLILTVNNSGIPPTLIGVDLEDLVTINLAEYEPINRVLSIQAKSCDALAPPVLTAVGFGNLTSGYLAVNNVNAPPSVLTVSSSGGGLDTKEVTIASPRRYLPLIMNP